jgi:hypothetical protein
MEITNEKTVALKEDVGAGICFVDTDYSSGEEQKASFKIV